MWRPRRQQWVTISGRYSLPATKPLSGTPYFTNRLFTWPRRACFVPTDAGCRSFSGRFAGRDHGLTVVKLTRHALPASLQSIITGVAAHHVRQTRACPKYDSPNSNVNVKVVLSSRSRDLPCCYLSLQAIITGVAAHHVRQTRACPKYDSPNSNVNVKVVLSSRSRDLPCCYLSLQSIITGVAAHHVRQTRACPKYDSPNSNVNVKVVLSSRSRDLPCCYLSLQSIITGAAAHHVRQTRACPKYDRRTDSGVDTAPPTTGGPLYIKRERETDHKALLHGILSQHHAAAALLNYNHSNTGDVTRGPASNRAFVPLREGPGPTPTPLRNPCTFWGRKCGKWGCLGKVARCLTAAPDHPSSWSY
ncbi:ETS- transcription factor Elf-2 [Homalodisca vitripennis]|nr:ETS- transcription factor Elf-2 [Homalodisca vitripennis]